MFGLKSLQESRVIIGLSFAFRILRKETKLTSSKYWIFRPTNERSGGFNIDYPKICNRKYTVMSNSFFIRCARRFGSLPVDFFGATGCYSFKSKLKKLKFPDYFTAPSLSVFYSNFSDVAIQKE